MLGVAYVHVLTFQCGGRCRRPLSLPTSASSSLPTEPPSAMVEFAAVEFGLSSVSPPSSASSVSSPGIATAGLGLQGDTGSEVKLFYHFGIKLCREKTVFPVYLPEERSEPVALGEEQTECSLRRCSRRGLLCFLLRILKRRLGHGRGRFNHGLQKRIQCCTFHEGFSSYGKRPFYSKNFVPRP